MAYHQGMENAKKNANLLASLLTGWGIKESWAKIAAGAIIGALAAAGFLTQTSCSVSMHKLPDGSIALSGSVAQPQPVTVSNGK